VSLDDHYRDLANRLKSLRGLISIPPNGAKYAELFDEFVSVNEFELALHALCDFLLESVSTLPDRRALDQIEFLHQRMKLRDDCVSRLRQKRMASLGVND
jgi:hypothetical protein